MNMHTKPHGFRHVGDVLAPLVRNLRAACAANEIGPRYVAQGGEIVNVRSNNRMTPAQAKDYLAIVVEDALTVVDDVIVEVDLILIADLIRAIREAEGKSPTPPASISSQTMERAA